MQENFVSYIVDTVLQNCSGIGNCGQGQRTNTTTAIYRMTYDDAISLAKVGMDIEWATISERLTD